MIVHRMNESIENKEYQEISVGFTVGKEKNVDPESNDCYAKRVDFSIRQNDSSASTKKSNYYLKFGVNGFIYDPWGIYSEGTQHKEARHAGKMAWSFRKVNKKCFNMYLTYLESKNKSFLNNAEREARNG